MNYFAQQLIANDYRRRRVEEARQYQLAQATREKSSPNSFLGLVLTRVGAISVTIGEFLEHRYGGVIGPPAPVFSAGGSIQEMHASSQGKLS